MMSDLADRSEGINVPSGSGDEHGAKKRPRLTFINPAELMDFEKKSATTPVNEVDVHLYQRLIDRQTKSQQGSVVTETSKVESLKSRKNSRQQKPRKPRSKKRPTDPKRPWLDSDAEEADCALPVEDDSDDDAFLQRLVEEKEREEAEEIKKKRELQRQRQLKREERRLRATGRRGRPRTQLPFARLYANSVDDPQSSSKPSETSDGEQSLLNDYNEEEDVLDYSPPPSIGNESSNGHGAAAQSISDNQMIADYRWFNAVTLRRRAPPLKLLASSQDLLCPPEHLLDILSIYETLKRYGRLLRLSPFQFDDFLSALVANENSNILAEVHIVLLNALMTEDDVNGTHLCPPDCKDGFSLISSFLNDRYTWPYLLSLYLASIKQGEVSAVTALAHLGNSVTVGTAGPIAAVTVSGGADVVVTSALFPDHLIPLDPSYPFVELQTRVAVLRGLVGLFLATGPVRSDILREGFTAHDDFCRVCRQSGEVLCCDNCPAVFHLTCLTPPLDTVPNTSWHCPLCVAEQEAYGDKKVHKPSGQIRIQPLGYDRAGRVYWSLEGRLFVEPVDFAQVEPELPGLMEGLRDVTWERLEAEMPGDDSCEDEGEEADAEGLEQNAVSDPTAVYANEPHVYYYSSLDEIKAVRMRLSTQWEAALCAQIDTLVSSHQDESDEQKPITAKPEPSADASPDAMSNEECSDVNRQLSSVKAEGTGPPPTTKWPPVLPLPPALTAGQLTSLFADPHPGSKGDKGGITGNGEAEEEEEEEGDEQSAWTFSITRAVVLELSGGVLLRNQDGLFENFPLSPDDFVVQLTDPRPPVVYASLPESARMAPSIRWRGWTNPLSRGYFVPTAASASVSANTGANTVNIAFNRLQQHDERERRRLLGNKFSLTDLALEAWRWLDSEASAAMIRHAVYRRSKDRRLLGSKTEPVDTTSLLVRRGDAVGPVRWLHTMKLTLCYLEVLLPAAVLCPMWRLLRRDWLAAVLKATSVGDLADLLSRLEAAIRPVAFQRTWSSSVGLLQLDRFTSAQREQEKRLRAIERSSTPANTLSANLVRTKTVRPIRHTVWKARGEEYRRLGGDGWQWVSATRRSQTPPSMVDPKSSTLDSRQRRPIHLGIGWGVLPELLSRVDLHPLAANEPTLDYGVHPITGVPLCRNVPRCIYKTSVKELQQHAEKFLKGDGATTTTVGLNNNKEEEEEEAFLAIDISKCLRDGGSSYFPPPARPPVSGSLRGGRITCLDSLLALREAAASRDLETCASARRELAQLREQFNTRTQQANQIRSRLAEVTVEAQSAREEHTKALKARQAAIAEMRRLSQQTMSNFSRPSASFSPTTRRTGARNTRSRRSAAPLSAASRRFQREEYNYDSGDSVESAESSASGLSPRESSTAGSSALRRSSRRQKTKSVDPDFVVDFGEEDEEEVEEEKRKKGRHWLGEGELDFRDPKSDGEEDRVDAEYHPKAVFSNAQPVHSVLITRGGNRLMSQLDGADDDDDGGGVDNYLDENGSRSGDFVPEKTLLVTTPCSQVVLESSKTAIMPTLPTTRVTMAPAFVPTPGKSLLVQAIEGKTPGVVQIKQPILNGEVSAEPKVVLASVASVLSSEPTPTTPSPAAGVQPVRLVRVLRGPPGTPAGTQVIQALDNVGGCGVVTSTGPTATTTNLIIPASNDSVLQNSLIQLSSSGGVIMTQASALPAGYRLIMPSNISLNNSTMTTTTASRRTPLNFVQVVPPSSTVTQPRALAPQLVLPRPGGVVNTAAAPSLVSIAPSPMGVHRTSTLRPLLAPPTSYRPTGTSNLAPPLRLPPRMVHVLPQTLKLDPGLDLAVSSAATRLHQADLKIFNLRKELKQLQQELSELSAQIEEREELVSRAGDCTAQPYILQTAVHLDRRQRSIQMIPRLDRAIKASHGAAGILAKAQRFLALPRYLPVINPYAWPPDRLFFEAISSQYPHEDQKNAVDPSAGVVPSLFRLSRANLRGVISAAGRKDIPGYEAEKKRLASIPWSYPTARPCFSEAWRFRLRQILHTSEEVTSVCGALNTPSHYGVLMASLAMHMRILWHCLRWDDLLACAATSEDADVDAFGRYCFKQVIPESHRGGYAMRRVTAIQPQDKYWLRANFLVQTSVHKPVKSRKRSARVGSTENAHPTTRRSTRGKRFADPDYDPAVDEGWRVGVPSNATVAAAANKRGRGRSARRLAHSDEDEEEEEDGDELEGDATSDDFEDSLGMIPSRRHAKEEWVGEDSLHLWEIRNFFDTLIPIDGEYPPPLPPLALTGLSESVALELSSALKVDDVEESRVSPPGSWIQPAYLPSSGRPLPPSPKPPHTPPPLTPVVIEQPKTLLVDSLERPIAPACSLGAATSHTPAFRPLIVNSSNRPQVFQSPVPSVSARPSLYTPMVQFTKVSYASTTQSSAASRGRVSAPAAPLSPKSEAARARARSLAASHAARISAANRRLRNEKAALEIRTTALADELTNRRKLTVKFLALQIQEDIIQARKAERDCLSEPSTPEETGLSGTRYPSPLPSPRTPLTKPTSGAGTQRRPPPPRMAPSTGSMRRRGRPPGSLRRPHHQSAIARQQPVLQTSSSAVPYSPGTPPTEPATESDEEKLAMPHGSRNTTTTTQLSLKQVLRVERGVKTNTTGVVALTPRGRRPGRPRGSGARQLHAQRDNGSTVSALTAQATTPLSRSDARGVRGKRRLKRGGLVSGKPPRLPIRTPSYLLKEQEKDDEEEEEEADAMDTEEEAEESSLADSQSEVGEERRRVQEAKMQEGDKVYCLCKTPYDPAQEYIGCDLCQDWFHFVCVGLKPGSSAAVLGDSWHCPDCQRDEIKVNEEVYCLCRTPYDTTRVYIACDHCDEWYHAECIGMEPDAVARHEGEYVCPVCIKGRGVTRVSKSAKKTEGQADEFATSKTLYEACLTESVKEALDTLMTDLMAHKLAWPFMKPPPLLALKKLSSPLKEPTDLPRFVEGLKRGVYKSIGDVSLAGNRLFSNARLLYTNDSSEFYCTEVLEALFLRRMKEVRTLVEHTT